MPARFAHADNAAATDGNAGVADPRERIEPILIYARRHDLAIEFRCRIEIVIVVIQARFLERFGVTLLQHPERAARLETLALHRAHQIDNARQFPIPRSTPRGPHAETCCAGGTTLPGDTKRAADAAT